MSVTLRPIEAADLPWLDGWLGAVAASVGYEIDATAAGKDLHQRVESSNADARVIERDERAGVIVWRRISRSTVIIELVATPPSEARRGCGMAAAATLETMLAADGVRRLYVPAPAVHGIAMYFWIRLGYRPLLRQEWPCERDGVAWLAREINRTG